MALSDYQLRNALSYGGSSGEETVTYNYRVPVADWKTFIPAFGASLVDSFLGTVYFQNYTRPSIAEDDAYVLLSLTYADNLGRSAIVNKEDNANVWLPVPSTFEKPLEQAVAYKTKWNYDLYQLKSSSLATPAWQGTATDISDGTGEVWLWGKDSPGDDWKLQEVKTKPGIEAWVAPAFASQYHFWNATYAVVVAVLEAVATRVTPAQTFGYPGEWLVTAVTINEDGNRYKGTVEFTNATVWDHELYS